MARQGERGLREGAGSRASLFGNLGSAGIEFVISRGARVVCAIGEWVRKCFPVDKKGKRGGRMRMEVGRGSALSFSGNWEARGWQVIHKVLCDCELRDSWKGAMRFPLGNGGKQVVIH